MKPAGAIYHGENQDYLAVYRFNRDVHVRLPEGVAGERVAHIAYSMGKKQGSIDIFPIKDENAASEKINLKKDIFVTQSNVKIESLESKPTEFFSKNTLDEIIQSQDVEGEILKHSNFEEIQSLAVGDIASYCQGKVAETENSKLILPVEKLSTKTKLETINKSKWLSGGKSEFVKECQLEANIDFTEGCLASFVPGENASFKNGIFNDYFHFVGGDCDYCYASPKHKSFPKTIFKFDKEKVLDELSGNCNLVYGSEEVLGRPVRVLRFGKRTESWTPFTEDAFMGTLELMTQTKTRGVIPTKFLPYQKEVSDLVKKTNSTLIYSIGDDDWESGAVEYGATNEFRMAEAIKYRKDGANVMFYLALRAPFLPPQERELKILETARKNNIQVQVLPMRHGSKDFAHKATGQNWDYLKDSAPRLDLFGDGNIGAGSYMYNQGNGLLPIQYHSDWMKIIGNNKGQVKMCHHDNKNVYCGTCSYKPGFIIPNKN